MTLWRQDWNGGLGRRPGNRVAAALVLGVCLLRAAPALAQATTERVVTNRVSGYAISGFDPVAYFVHGGPVAGRGEYVFVYDRALWRFDNEGNLAAFQRHPEVYEPLFGGYDLARYVHFFAMAGLVGFVAVHLVMVLLVPRTLVYMLRGR